MVIIPAISLDLRDPRSYAVAAAAQEWERTGFSRVQLDLRPAERHFREERLLNDLLRDIRCPVQVAGRFQASDEIDVVLEAGAGFVVLRDRALDDFDWLATVADRFPEQLILSSPLRERRARNRGAVRTLPLDLRDIAVEIAGLPLAAMAVEFTADATIGHPELAILEDVVEELAFPVQVAGTSFDLATLRDLDFRGVGATIMDAAQVAAFDAHGLARSFGD